MLAIKCNIFYGQNDITRAIIDRMSATASRNSKEAFDNLIWGFNLGPIWEPSIGLNRTDTFLSLITKDHKNLKLLWPKTKMNKIWTIWTNFDSPWAPKWTPMPKNIAQIIHIANMTTSWKLEATMTKDKKIEILTIWTDFESPLGPQMGSYTKIYCIDDFI